jgi:hypothetical protein
VRPSFKQTNKKSQKGADRVAEGVGPEFKPQYRKKKKYKLPKKKHFAQPWPE